MSNKIIRLPEVKSLTGLSRSSIYLRMSKNEFPQNISLGGRAVGWLEKDINNWLEDKITARKPVAIDNVKSKFPDFKASAGKIL